ncbi:CatB-related O-acetyltransferase [Roseomonas sp. WA12]
MIVTEELIKVFGEARIFLSVNGQQRLRTGSPLFVSPGAQVECYSSILNGGTIPKAFGSFSYTWSPLKQYMTVGRYCSLAGGISFMGADHPHHWVSTSPFAFQPGPAVNAAYRDHGFDIASRKSPPYNGRKNKLIIGNDVWIGGSVLLRDGITIGDGAVVAGGSVVTKDVAPYEIVGGAPAKHIRFRFPEPIVERLRASRWWRFHPAVLNSMQPHKVEAFLERIEDALAQGTISPFVTGHLVFPSASGLPEYRPPAGV